MRWWVVPMLGVLACRNSLADMEARLPAVGARTPTFDYPLLEGGRFSSRDLAGSVTVLALWSTTCGASRLSLEALGALQASLQASHTRVVILAGDTQRADVQRVLDSADVAIPVALAGEALAGKFAVGRRWPWQEVALPSFLVLDSAGVVRGRVVGVEQERERRLDRVRQALDALAR